MHKTCPTPQGKGESRYVVDEDVSECGWCVNNMSLIWPLYEIQMVVGLIYDVWAFLLSYPLDGF